MMNVDKDNVEPVTNLQLAVAYRYPFAPRRLSNLDVGAGANAASRVDLDFVAAAPLSELVWSPHNGLSLKCADLRFFEKQTSLLWDVGPSNMVLSPPQGTTSKVPGREEPRDEGNLITSQVAFHVTSIIDEGPSLVRSPRSIGYNTSRTTDNIEKMNIVGRASIGDTNLKEVKTSKGKDLCSPNNNQMYSMDETKEINSGPKNQKTDFTLLKTNERRSNIIQDEPLDELNEVKVGLDIPVPNLISPVGRREDLSVAIEEEHKNKMKIDGPTTGMPLEKLDLSTENELQLLIVKDKSAASEAPSSNSRTGLNGRKHKEKAFSDEAVNERTSKDEPGSHESVESCNSAGPAVLFSTGKKRWGFEQLTAESKRVKKQIREGPSTCFIRQDSSFVNWISNMVNGLNKTNQDEVPSLALTLSRPDHEAESGNQKIITYSRNKDPGSMNMDFQTNFQSLYSSNPNEQERKMSIGNSPIGVSKVVLDDKLSGAYITPLSCYGDFDEFCKQFVLPKEKFNESKSGNEAGQSVKPNTLAANIITSSCSDQNKTSCKLACTSVRDGRYSSSSRGKHNIESDKNNDSDLPHGLEGIDKVGGRCDVLESFWFTRFSSKTPRTMLNWDKCDQNTSEALMCSTDCTRLIAHTNDRINQKSSDAKEYSTEVPVNVVGKELHNYAPNSEASFCFGGIHGHSDQKSTCKLNPIVPSPKSNNSEAMASEFAKRLDALKHIIPLDVTDNTRHTRTTCFYCGKSGHNLRHCSEIEEIERENLIRNLSSYDGAEESPCLCIRCFQLDHWAISCLKETKQTHCEVDGENTDCEDNVLKEKKIGPSSQLVDEKFSDVQKGIFDAIRKLCLSRMDILKWMNSQTSSLHLDGFFLRLRLGKWEEALGGTGYYVACITGEQREKPPQGSKKPLSVNIGGIRCMVESQYISNQDFLQDELMVWWCATVRSGGKIPSEDHLKSKFEERQRLGF